LSSPFLLAKIGWTHSENSQNSSTMQIFWLEVLNSTLARLNQSESLHCRKVLRHQKGDEIFCIDGKGKAYRTRIKAFEKQQTQLEILETIPGWGEHNCHIRLIVSPLRLKDRFEWLIEKSVELGVTEIYPVQCLRTDKYKAKFKPERLNTLLLTATKQCKRSRIPILHPVQGLNDYLSLDRQGPSYLAYCEAETLLQEQKDQIAAAAELNLLIGPEGDFTEAEVEWAEAHGFQRISLGKARLRTETAGIYGLGVFKMVRGY
jgi:16S rRNA (uracil1498-N3)-methyltransferase